MIFLELLDADNSDFSLSPTLDLQSRASWGGAHSSSQYFNA